MHNYLRLQAVVLGCLVALVAWGQRIAVLSDIHVTPGNACDSALRVAVAEINADPSIDFVVVDGDLTNEGSDQQLRHVKGILDGIAHPCRVLPGNHEDTWSQSATKTFPDLWGADRFHVLLGDSLLMVGINCGPYMKMGDGHIKQEDLFWLDSVMYAHPGVPVLSFCHYPPRKDDLDNYQDYTALLNYYPVKAHVSGHYHSWMTYPVDSVPGIGVRALHMPKAGTYGYAILDIGADSVRVYNKDLGLPARLYKAVACGGSREIPESAYMDNQPARGGMWDDGQGAVCVWDGEASIFTRLGFDDLNVYFGTSSGDAIAADKATGQLMWRRPLEGALFSRPVILGHGLVSFPASDGIHALHTGDGSEYRFFPMPGGPYVADGVTAGTDYVLGGYRRIHCVDLTDGSLRWTYDSIGNYCQAAPVIDGSDIVFGAWDTNLRCLDRASGHLKWQWNNGKKNNMLGPGNVVPVVTSERVYIVAPDRYMTALDRRTGRQLWRDHSHKYRESLGRSADGTRVYAKTMDGELVAVDATVPDFKELWTLDLGLGYEHAPCIVAEQNGRVYAGSRRGIVTVVDPSVPKVVAIHTLGQSEVNGIDIDPADGSVWVSLVEGRVWRLP